MELDTYFSLPSQVQLYKKCNIYTVYIQYVYTVYA